MSDPVIFKMHQFKVGPRRELTERRVPYRYTDGFFRVYDPSGSAKYNTNANATKVSTLAEVASHVRRGFGVRMTGPYTPSPSLCGPTEIVIEN
jgi:hypothetical protein